ncbi:MAG: glycosyltransferase family 39 protein [Chloroflexota bacterium]|nr:glycosyltransferase family 39 protein [Chloroflexota bacterium]
MIARSGVLLACAAAAAYLVLVGSQIERPLMYDDANFALAARAVAETGLPFGNQGWMSERGDFTQREQWALWHPPLYVYAEGLAARVGGWTPPVLRVLGVLGGLASAGLTYLLAADLTRGTHAIKRVAGGVAAALVLVCPLVVQSTLVLDIDFPLLLPLTLLFVLGYLRLEGSRRAWLWLAPLFALLLWSKMTNPLAVLAAAVVWQALHGPRRFARAGLHLVGIGVGGAAVFSMSWLVVGRWLSFPLDMPFGVNLVQWQDSADVARRAYTSPGAFVEGLQPSTLWLGPGLVALGLMGVAVRGAQLVRCWRVRHVDLLIGVLAALVLGYVNKSAGWFPKYQVAFAPLLACTAAPIVAWAWCERPRLTAVLGLCVSVGAAVITLRSVRDDWALERTWAVDPTAGAWLLGLVVAAALVGLPARRATGSAACAALVGLGLGWSVGTDVYQRNASYSTTYWYGTRGTAEAAMWVDSRLARGEPYAAAKEVAIRSRDQRYVDQDTIVYFLSTGRGFDGTWAGENLKALVAWQREPYVADLLGRGMPASGFVETARFGDYVVYEPAAG